MKQQAKNDEPGRPDRDRPGDAVRQEDVGDGPTVRTQPSRQRRERAHPAVADEDRGFGCDKGRCDGNGSITTSQEPADDEPHDGRQLREEDRRVNALHEGDRDRVGPERLRSYANAAPRRTVHAFQLPHSVRPIGRVTRRRVPRW